MTVCFNHLVKWYLRLLDYFKYNQSFQSPQNDSLQPRCVLTFSSCFLDRKGRVPCCNRARSLYFQQCNSAELSSSSFRIQAPYINSFWENIKWFPYRPLETNSVSVYVLRKICVHLSSNGMALRWPDKALLRAETNVPDMKTERVI